MAIYVGTAGWSIPPGAADRFRAEGTGLERYAATLGVTEINSSFHRSHQSSTWARWRDSVPGQFRFSVKIPKQVTHVNKLVDCEHEVDSFIAEAGTLGEKLAVLLVQLPPKLAFDEPVADNFFRGLSERTTAAIACEPRHASWFTDDADRLLGDLSVARVAADPAICEAAATPGGHRGLSYWRLHGSPVTYRSSYGDRVQSYAARLASEEVRGADVWCIFDNTASSAAAMDALALIDALSQD